MIEVELPGGAIAEFPDGTSTDVIQGVLRKQFGGQQGEQPSAAMGIGKSLAAGAGKGVAGLIGLPGLASRGADWLLSKGEEALGIPAPAPAPSAPPNLLPQPGQVQSAMESVTGPFYKPQNRTEEYAQTIGEFIPGALMGPGGVARNVAAFGVVPGVASEAAGGATKGTALEPYARGGAALASGGLAAFLTARGNAGGAVSRAAGGADNATLQQAEALFQEAQALGTPITRAEAVQAVTGGATNFGNLQRVVEGQGGMRDFYAGRAAQNDAAAGRVFDQVTPAAPTPSAIGPAVGTAAEGTINDVRGVINQASEPFYNAAATVRLTPQEMQQVRALPGYAEASRAVRGDPQLARYVQGLPEDSVGFLNEVKKYLDTAAENAAAPVNAQRNMQRSAGYGNDASTVRAIGEAASPDYAAALMIQRESRERFLQPLLDGPLGKIAARDTTTKKAIDALFPNSPLPNSAQEIETAVRAVSQRNPNAARQLVRAHLESTFNEATQNLASGVNSYGGAKFAAIVRGNPQQAANLEAAISALPGGANMWPGVDRFLTILEAQGQRQAIGSQTAFNQEVLRDLRGSSLAGEVGKNIASGGFKIPQSVKDGIERYRLGNNVDELARLFTDPAAGREFMRLATANNAAAVTSAVVRIVGLAQRGAANPSQQTAGPKN